VYSVDDLPEKPGKDGNPTGYVYKGFFVLLPIDPRFIEDNPEGPRFYYSRCMTSRQMMIRMPAWNYTVLNQQAAIEIGSSRPMTNSIIDAMDITRNGYKELLKKQPQTDLQWKVLNLNFDAPVQLSSSVIYDGAGDAEVVEWDYIDVTDSKGQTVHFAGFRVARTDIQRVKKGKHADAPKISEDAEKLQRVQQQRALAHQQQAQAAAMAHQQQAASALVAQFTPEQINAMLAQAQAAQQKQAAQPNAAPSSNAGGAGGQGGP